MNLYITKQGSKIGIKQGEVYIEDPKTDEVRKFPLGLLENIFIFGNIKITTPAIKNFLRNKIRVLFLSNKGDYIGSLISIDQDRVLFKYKQWETFKNLDYRLYLSKIIVKEKYNNQKGLIYGFSKNQNKSDIYKDFIAKTEYISKKINDAKDLDELRGIEGAISSEYFYFFGKLILNSEFTFSKRTHYPPKDEVNSLLSFGYTLLVNFITGFIIAKSMDPYVGFYHENKYKRENLSLDLMEELRPKIDSITLKLINLKMITKDNFEKVENYFLIKKPSLKKIFYLFQDEIISHKKIITTIEKRINQVAKIIQNA